MAGKHVPLSIGEYVIVLTNSHDHAGDVGLIKYVVVKPDVTWYVVYFDDECKEVFKYDEICRTEKKDRLIFER